VLVDASAKSVVEKEALEWSSIAKEIVESRAKMQEEMDKIDFEEAVASVIKLWHVDNSKLISF
jgi:methionyl-tRNA synthetase